MQQQQFQVQDQSEEIYQQQIVPYKFESLLGSKLVAESEESQTYQDSSFPSLDQLEKLILDQFNQLSEGMIKENYEKLLNQIKQELYNREISMQMIQDGQNEIKNLAYELISDFKKFSPTFGIVVQDQLASRV